MPTKGWFDANFTKKQETTLSNKLIQEYEYESQNHEKEKQKLRRLKTVLGMLEPNETTYICILQHWGDNGQKWIPIWCSYL